MTESEPIRQPQAPATIHNRIRWWPAVAILVAVAVALPGGLLYPPFRNVGQHRSMWFVSVIGSGMILLSLWLVLASRLSAKVRVAAAVLIALFCSGVALGFRIEGVTGDLRPILAPRFRLHSARDTAGSNELASPIDLMHTTPHDFPQFLGPDRDAIVRDVRLDPDWTAYPPKLLWRIPVGEAWSSFAVVGDYAVTQEQSGTDEQVVCYELRTGKPVWRYVYPAEFRTVIAGTGPRATPSIDGGRVFTMGATGILNCLDGGTGKKIWSRNTLGDATAINREWGNSCSPLVLGDKVVVTAGGEHGWSVIAYHKETGEVIWHGGSSYSQYASPVFCSPCGVPQIVVLNHTMLTAHDPDDGHILWERPFGAGQATVANPIPVGENRLFVSAGYGYGCVLLELSRDTKSDFQVNDVWPLNRSMKMKFTNGVVRDGCVFGLDEGVLACLDLATGKRRWRAGRYGHGQLLLVDDLLLVQSETGPVYLVRANSKKHEELASFNTLDGKTWNNPALAGSLLLVRNDKEAACYELATQ